MSCALEIIDIGQFSIIGMLRDIRTGEIIKELVIYPKDDEWLLALDAEDILDNIPIKK